jgi:hypothetical protein
MLNPAADLGEWAASEVFSAQWDGDNFQRSLHRTDKSRGAFDVVGDRAEPEGTDDGVERGVVERQFVGVGLLQRGGAPELG